jgi:L-threonylcarbamoyladenylate synthase
LVFLRELRVFVVKSSKITQFLRITRKMPYHSPFKIKTAVYHLQAGAVIAYPTEAVYGLGCDPLNENAVMSLLDIKQRPIEKGLILIASSFDQLRPYLVLDQTIINRITPTWPGPVTWVIPARSWVPKWLTGAHDSLAVRVTDHPVARDLCAQFGSPLVSTSANPTTRPAIKESRKLLKTFVDADIFIVHGKVGMLDQETAIYDALSGKRLR